MRLLILGLAWVGICHAVVGPQWTWDEGMEEPAGEKDMGGWVSRVYTAEQMERLGVDEFGHRLEEEEEDEEVDDETVGCCYDHGFGSRMVPCCFSNHRMIKKQDCFSRHRFGGSSKFDSRNCEVVMQEQGIQSEDESSMGCCYEHGFGSRHKPCCYQNHRSSKREDCDEKKRMGGGTKFDERDCASVMKEQGVDFPEQTLLQKLLPGILPVNLDMLAADNVP